MHPKLSIRRTAILLLASAVVLVGTCKIPGRAIAANGAATSTYDALGRVTSVTYDTGVVITYTYDANGNRTAQAINVNTAGLTWQSTAVVPCTANCWDASVWN